MADEKFWWDDKTIQIPKGLLIKGVPGEATAVYAKMKGFGVDVRCSLRALATRLDWTEPRVRIWQRWLWERRWIVLLKEGENRSPREWWMCSAPGELPPQELVARVSKNGTLPPQATENRQGDENPAPGKTAPEANKVLQANNEVLKTPPDKPAKHPDQDAFWSTAKAIWAAKHNGAVLAWPKDAKGFNGRLSDELERLGGTELARRWGNCVNDPWSRPSLRAFILDTDKWITAREAKGKPTPGGRAFHPAAGSDWRPSDDH